MRRLPQVAVYCADEAERRVISFTLGVRLQMIVLQYDDPEEMFCLLSRPPIPGTDGDTRAAVVIHEGRTEQAIARTLAILEYMDKYFPHTPVLLLDMPKVLSGREILADYVLRGLVDTVAVVSAIQTMSARKRQAGRTANVAAAVRVPARATA